MKMEKGDMMMKEGNMSAEEMGKKGDNMKGDTMMKGKGMGDNMGAMGEMKSDSMKK